MKLGLELIVSFAVLVPSGLSKFQQENVDFKYLTVETFLEMTWTGKKAQINTTHKLKTVKLSLLLMCGNFKGEEPSR